MADSRHAHGRSHAHGSERLPHIFGAQSGQYRQGTSFANGDTPPAWTPEMALTPGYAYTLEEWCKDLMRWIGATKADAARHGPLIALQVGGAARSVVDEIDTEILRNGQNADFQDGRGFQAKTGSQMLVQALKRKFPTNQEALMLRTGMEFFQFTPRREETLEALLLRFDTLLDRANTVANLNIEWPFRSWMLMSILRLPAKKWTELLKEAGHVLPRTEAAYTQMKQVLCRERALESTIATMHSKHATPTGQHYLVGDDDKMPLPLYLCLGGVTELPEEAMAYLGLAEVNPQCVTRTMSKSEADYAFHASGSRDGDDSPRIAYYDLGDAVEGSSDGDNSDNWSTDTEEWREENKQDPYPDVRLRDEEEKGKVPGYISEVWWAARKAVRRYRAAKGKFGPRRGSRHKKVGKRFWHPKGKRFGKGRRPRRGFFIGRRDFIAIPDEVTEETLNAFFNKGSRNGPRKKKGSHKDTRCYRCGESGHWSKDCKLNQDVCFNCKQPGQNQGLSTATQVVPGC